MTFSLNLTLVGGLSGSGKSWFARSLARLSDTTIIEDTKSLSLVGNPSPPKKEVPKYRESEECDTTAPHSGSQHIITKAWKNLKEGISVIVLDPFIEEFYDKKWFRNVQNECNDNGIGLKAYWLTCSPENLKSRIIALGFQQDEWKLKNWDSWISNLPHEDDLPKIIKVIHSDNVILMHK